MARGFSYVLPGVPEVRAGSGVSAFTPSYSWHAASGAIAYKYGIRDGPARAHPINTEDTYFWPDVGDLATAGGARSTDAPDVFWTDDYNLTNYDPTGFVERPGAGMPVATPDPSDTPGWRSLLPVPAQDYRAQYQADSARLARRTILQRMKSIPWFPRVYRSTPDVQGGPQFNG